MMGNKCFEVRSVTFLVVWLLVSCATALSRQANTGESVTKPASQPVRYMIVVTGSELLTGAYADGHTFFLTRTLRPLGLECVGSMCVDDKQADIREALRFAADKAGLVIVTGGLGPTENDITREALRDFTGIALQEHPDVLAAMAKRFNVPAGELRPNLRQQTQVPAQGTYLKNATGTAVGLVFETAAKVIIALPGPPRELQPMVENELVPYLSRRFGTRPPGRSLTLRFVGLGQSQIDQTLKDNVPLPPEVTTSSQFEGGRVDFTFSLPNGAEQGPTRLQELKEKILKHLGDYVYASDETTSLEDHVVKLLEARGTTLSLAEVGSGGALAAALHGTAGAGRVLTGAYTAPSQEKLQRLLATRQEPRDGNEPSQMAAMVAAATGSACAIAVSAIQRDERGTSLVEVTFRSPDGRTENRQVRLSGTGESARSRLVTELLDQLRRRLRDTGESR